MWVKKFSDWIHDVQKSSVRNAGTPWLKMMSCNTPRIREREWKEKKIYRTKYQYKCRDIRIHTCIVEMTAKNRRTPNPSSMFSHCSHTVHEEWIVVRCCVLCAAFAVWRLYLLRMDGWMESRVCIGVCNGFPWCWTEFTDYRTPFHAISCHAMIRSFSLCMRVKHCVSECAFVSIALSSLPIWMCAF